LTVVIEFGQNRCEQLKQREKQLIPLSAEFSAASRRSLSSPSATEQGLNNEGGPLIRKGLQLIVDAGLRRS
jgi:hypothetical protein